MKGLCIKKSSCLALPLLLLLTISQGYSAPSSDEAQSVPEGRNPGPDIITGDIGAIGGLEQFGSDGTQVGLGVSTTACNAGNVVVKFIAMPDTHHPIIPHNLYRMSGGPGNDERFEQIGQSWVKHAYGSSNDNECGFGCIPSNFSHLGVGCSDTYANFQNAEQIALGSRALVNPFTGVFQSTAVNHTDHTHTETSHRILVEGSDLNTTLNPGATYYAEVQYISSDEYEWCQAHPGQCNMYNNASYRQFSVSGTTSFTFSAVGFTVHTAAINAWPGATISPIEPEPGIDGRAFIACKVTGPVGGLWHYEYALYNENLDRAIQSFSIPLGCGTTVSNLGFHAPLNHPGFPNDGTLGDAGFSNAAWSSTQSASEVSWSTESFAQNPNANAIRWGTLYNFRFDSVKPPLATKATIGFFKTGTPVAVNVLGPNICDVTPTPSPTATPTPATPTPTATPCSGTVFMENFDGVTAPALPPSWDGDVNWVTSTTTPDTAPNDAFVDDPAEPSDRFLETNLVISSAVARVSFRNYYSLETGYDGGVLEISSPNINAGAFTDVTNPAVGGRFVSGGYNSTIAINSFSPIAGRQAWSGHSGGYLNTVVRLGPNVDGRTIRLRFRMASDVSVPDVGWRIDTVTSTGVCVGPISTPTPTPPPTPTPTPTPTPAPQALNLSTRMRVQTGDNVGIGGFIITGTAPKHLLLRAIGPSLAQSGIPDVLADPVLELHGPGGFVTITNDNWRDDAAQEAAIIATGIPPANNLESAIDATLNPGAYTGIVRGQNNTSGVGLVEVYDLSQAVPAKLANISTRAFVGTGSDIMIAGFILGGHSGATRIIVRGLGPSLTATGVIGALPDPTLQLRDSNGTLLMANNNWQDDTAQANQLTAAGLAPANNLESGIAMTLSPGLYTALLGGQNNVIGVGLIEVYDLGSP